jgi:uncharacterized protein with HEPN domain
MVRRSQRLRLLDIAAQISAIEAAVANQDESRIRSDWLLRSAVELGVEIISEASRHLDPELIAAYPEVPWRQVADIGNWLRHAYEQVDPALILAVITGHFPALRRAVADMLARTPED